jgi:hypothetical protein
MKLNILLSVTIVVSTHLYAIEIKVPLSIGDLIDKITILQVKLEKISDPNKIEHISHELDLLLKTLENHVPHSPQLEELSAALHEINRTLWDIEDGTRTKEAKQEFDQDFIELARSVYINNGYRHALKREINILTGSDIIEEKQYAPYP